jgi:hypothetical protein
MNERPDDDPIPESDRERFLRNHQEHIGTMRAIVLRARRLGRAEDAERMQQIVETWERIGRAVAEADDEGDGEAS